MKQTGQAAYEKETGRTDWESLSSDCRQAWIVHAKTAARLAALEQHTHQCHESQWQSSAPIFHEGTPSAEKKEYPKHWKCQACGRQVTKDPIGTASICEECCVGGVPLAKPSPDAEAAEIVASILKDAFWRGRNPLSDYYPMNEARDLLARLRSVGFVQLAEDQSLPIAFWKAIEYGDHEIIQGVLKDAGFRRIKPEVKEGIR